MNKTNAPTPLDKAIAAFKALPLWLVLLGLLIGALTILLVSVSEANQKRIAETWKLLREVRDRTDRIEDVRTQLLNAETAQRGFLLTGNTEDLKPLVEANIALRKLIGAISAPFPQLPGWEKEIVLLTDLVTKKMVNVQVTTNLAKMGKREAALEILSADTEKALMDQARDAVASSIRLLEQQVGIRRAEMDRNILISRLSIFAIALLNLMILAAAVYVFSQDLKRKELLVGFKETENQRLTELVANRTSELNDLATFLQTSSETERAAIARDLHDELGGVLTSVKMDVDWALARVQSLPNVVERLTQSNQLLEEAVSVKRRVIENLRPSLLDNLGLTAALEWYVHENCNRGDLVCTLDLPEELPPVSSEASIAFFRIVQESMTNTLHYAAAKNFSVSIVVDTADILLIVTDDGIGLPAQFNPTKLSHGLSGIRQRVLALKGKVRWESTPGQGTKLIVTVPRQVVETTSRDVEVG